MQASEVRRAVKTASSLSAELGLPVEDAIVVHNSDRIALRLIPCDVLARVGPSAHLDGFQFEVEVAHRLAETDSPVGELDPRVEPRVYRRDDFVISLWTYHEPVAPSDIAPADYAHALMKLHANLRQVELEAPRFTDQVASRQVLIAERERTPELVEADRELLSRTLSHLSTAIIAGGSGEQLLHGEPHPGNVLSTRQGPLFIDLATCCRGPLEYDLAFVPDDVRDHYPGVDPDMVHRCHALMWAMFAAQRWSRSDQLPNRSYWRIEGFSRLGAALDRGGIDWA